MSDIAMLSDLSVVTMEGKDCIPKVTRTEMYCSIYYTVISCVRLHYLVA